MSTNTSIKELLWNAGEIASLPSLIVSLILAAVLGLVLGQAYIRFGTALSNRRHFARNFLLLTVTTTLVISIVKSSLALSLGLVGALSIVRFRAAIKEPEELAFLFLAISIGLGLGAGQAVVTVVAIGLILGFVAIRHAGKPASEQANLYLTVTASNPGEITAKRMLDALGEVGASAQLKRFDESGDRIEASFQVQFGETENIEKFSRKMREVHPGVHVSCVDEIGLTA